VNGSCMAPDEYNRTWTVTNECGLSSTVVQHLIVAYPVVTFPPGVTAECPIDTSPENCGYANSTDPGYTTNYTDSYYYYNPCTEIASGNIYLVISRMWVVTDLCGPRPSVQEITILDRTPPQLTIPSDIILECDQIADVLPLPGSILLTNATAVDACTGSTIATFTDTQPERSSVNTGNTPVCTNFYLNARTTQRTWSSTDTCGNTVSLVQTISFQDTKAPKFVIGPKFNVTSLIVSAAQKCSLSDLVTLVGDLNVGLTYIDNCMPTPQVIEKYLGEFLTNCDNLTYSWFLNDWCNNNIFNNLSIGVGSTTPGLNSASMTNWSLFFFLCLWIFHLIHVNS